MNEQLNNQQQSPFAPVPKQPHEGSFSEIVKFALIAILIVLPIRLFVARPFIVSGSSMDPTFENGQYLIVDQFSYHFEKPHRGDVVIFRYPGDPSKFFIKRIIGLPNETIEAKNGIITIFNSQKPQGAELTEPYLQNKSDDNFKKSTNDQQYFVMGDNRPYSSDSRVWGNLDQSFIVGRPLLRLLPLDEKKLLPGQYSGY